MQHVRDTLERRQIAIYFCTVATAVLIALFMPGTAALERFVNPALALMLYTTFLQVPVAELRRALGEMRFLAALLVANFVVIPLLVATLMPFAPTEPLIRLGVLLVLLTPCIDYVVAFSHLGRADARLLLAATPALLITQMLLLPGFLRIFLGTDAGRLVRSGPFLHAFLWLIAVALILAALSQAWASRTQSGSRAATVLGLLPVPATAAVLFLVVGQLCRNWDLPGRPPCA